MEALSAKDCMPMTLKRFFLTLVALAAAVAFQMDQEYIEGEFDRYSDANSFIANYMAGKSGFQKVQ